MLRRPNPHTSVGAPAPVHPAAWSVLEDDTMPMPPPAPAYMEEAIAQAAEIDAVLQSRPPPVATPLYDMVQNGKEAHTQQQQEPVQRLLKAMATRVEYVWNRHVSPRSAVRDSETKPDAVVQMMQAMFMAAFLELRADADQKLRTQLRSLKEKIDRGEPMARNRFAQLDVNNWPSLASDSLRAHGAHYIIRNWRDAWLGRARNTRRNLGLTCSITLPVERALAACTHHFDPPRLVHTYRLPVNWQQTHAANKVVVCTGVYIGKTGVSFVFALAPVYDSPPPTRTAAGDDEPSMPLSMPSLSPPPPPSLVESPHHRMAAAAAKIQPARFTFPAVVDPPPLPSVLHLNPPSHAAAPISPLKRRLSDAAEAPPPAKRIETDQYTLSEPPHAHGANWLPPIALSGNFVLVCTPTLAALVRIAVYLVNGGHHYGIADDTGLFKNSNGGFEPFLGRVILAVKGGATAWVAYMRSAGLSASDKVEYGVALAILGLFVLPRPDESSLVADEYQRAALFEEEEAAATTEAGDDEDDFLFGGSDVPSPPPLPLPQVPTIEMPELTGTGERLNIVLGGMLRPNTATGALDTIRSIASSMLYDVTVERSCSETLGMIKTLMLHYKQLVKPAEAPLHLPNVWLYLAALLVACFDPERKYRAVRLPPDYLNYIRE